MLLFEPVAAVVTDTPSGQNLMMELKNFRPVLQAGLALEFFRWAGIGLGQKLRMFDMVEASTGLDFMGNADVMGIECL